MKKDDLCTPSQMAQCVAHFKQELERQFDFSRQGWVDHAEDVLKIIEAKLDDLRRDLKVRHLAVDRKLASLDKRLSWLEKRDRTK